MTARSGLSLLRNRNFILLFCAYGISAFGDHLSELGIMRKMAIEEGDEKTRIGALMLFCFFLPYVLLGPVAGALADRLPRKWIMIATDLARGLIALSIPWYIVWLDDPGSKMMILPIMGLGLFAAFFNPARLSFVPQVVADDRLTQANSLLNGLAPIAAIVSYIVGGWLVSHRGPSSEAWISAAFYGDAATFGLSAVLVACILVPRRTVSPDRRSRLIIQDIAAGARYIACHRRVWQLMIFTATFWTAAGIFSSVLPAVVLNWYDLGFAELGRMRATMGLGMLIGSILLTIIGDASRAHYNIIVALLGTGLAMLLFAATSQPWVGGVLGVAVGMFGVWIIISANTLIQRIVPDGYRGKVFGIIDLVNMAGMLLATGLLGDPFGILRWGNLDAHVGGVLSGLAVVMMVMGVMLWRHHHRRSPYSWMVGAVKSFNEVVCKFWYRLRRDGICTVPHEGGCIITANHTSGTDPCLLSAACHHRLCSWMVAREYYNLPLCRHLIQELECIPVRRDGRDIAATKQALRQLRAGKLLGIFIEGRIAGPDEEAQPRDGVAALALRSKATVIPAHISGVKYHDSVLLTFLLRHRVRIKYGPPVDLSEFTDPKDREQVHAATLKIWSAIQALAPEDGKVYLS
ncbi:MAG: MFS transporter [Planctomycetes bacterium]|nr:MFS transporter [Planctomycetota bacterium]